MKKMNKVEEISKWLNEAGTQIGVLKDEIAFLRLALLNQCGGDEAKMQAQLNFTKESMFRDLKA